ncbi:redoxin domain-containing protein [Pirellulaceae bacterium SH449]
MFRRSVLIACSLLWPNTADCWSAIYADDQHSSADSTATGPAPGHSMHAESFNEGPRQAGYLMPGMGNVHFPISTKHPLAQRFFDQGISQLHGFWYFEAERSFRQAASFDPDHPMHYWGMARANIENEKRSAGFIQQAVDRIAKANDKERRLIEAWNERVKQPEPKKETDAEANKSDDQSNQAEEKKDQGNKRRDSRNQKEERLKKYMSDLDSISVDYPDDVELKAMIVLQAWQNHGSGVPIQSFSSMNSLLSQIFQANPRHPAHHFRIHLWDYKKEDLALQSAAMCGPSAPGIAHMWHMPGHTYSRLKRYSDAAWQQEASARVDHAHMIRDHILPDQIHNFSHNNEWLVRSLSLIGKPAQAVSLAKNMIELPRHPKYNTLDNRGSASYGRERLLQVLTQYERWQELLELTDTRYLADEGDVHRSDERLGWRGIAATYAAPAEVAGEVKAKFAEILQELDKTAAAQTEIIERLKAEAAKAEAEKAEAAKAEAEKSEAAKAEVASEDAASSPTQDSAADSTKEVEKPEPTEPAAVEPEAATDTKQPSEPTAMELFGKSDDPALPKELSKNWRQPDDADAKKWSEERKNAEKALHEALYRKQRVSYWLNAIDAHTAAKNGDFRSALKHSHLARPIVSEWQRIEWLAQCGEPAEAWATAERKCNDSPGEFMPLVRGAWLASLVPENDAKVQELLEKLKPLAVDSERDIAAWVRLEASLQGKGISVDWNAPVPPPKDIGERPVLDSLGPFRWEPSYAPLWHAFRADESSLSSKHLDGKPYIAILYLGFGCLHCVEQLGAFSPKVEEFGKLGLEIVAISTEDAAQLREGMANYDKPIGFPLLSNVEQDTFRGFRAYDDFEGQPLHGTFLIDSRGKVLWQDIGHEPFMDVDFLLKESERLQSIHH